MREIMTWSWSKGLGHVGKGAVWTGSWSKHGATRQRACDWQPWEWGRQDLDPAGAGATEGNRNSWRGVTGMDAERRDEEKDTGGEGPDSDTGTGAAGEVMRTEKEEEVRGVRSYWCHTQQRETWACSGKETEIRKVWGQVKTKNKAEAQETRLPFTKHSGWQTGL